MSVLARQQLSAEGGTSRRRVAPPGGSAGPQPPPGGGAKALRDIPGRLARQRRVVDSVRARSGYRGRTTPPARGCLPASDSTAAAHILSLSAGRPPPPLSGGPVRRRYVSLGCARSLSPQRRVLLTTRRAGAARGDRMRVLVVVAFLLLSIASWGAFAGGRRNVDPETNMNIVSSAAGSGSEGRVSEPCQRTWPQGCNGARRGAERGLDGVLPR